MASIVFGAAGQALGGPLGGSIASLAGSAGLGVASRLLGGGGSKKGASNPVSVTYGQKLDSLYATTATEGAPIRRIWGRARLGGNIIWASQFRTYTDTKVTQTTTQAPAASGKGGARTTTQTSVNIDVTYHYAISFAVAFCEGFGSVSLGRIWADGQELDLSAYTWRFYDGQETQSPDPKIVQVEGVAPAYRGTCYIVFDDMPLDAFGNRIPQITAEILRRPIVQNPNDLSNCLRSICLIPGSGEFAIGTTVVKAAYNYGQTQPQNAHVDGRADILSSLDQFCGINAPIANAAVSPPYYDGKNWAFEVWSGQPYATGGNWKSSRGAVNNPRAASLVVAWFGDDLRAGSCTIAPRVETSLKNTTPYDWQVAGWTRGYRWVQHNWHNIGKTWWLTIDPCAYGAPNAVMQSWGVAAQPASPIALSALDPTGAGTSATFGGASLAPAYGGTPSDQAVLEAIAELKRRNLRVVFYPFVMMDIPPGNGKPDPYGGAEQAAFPWRGRITCHPAPGRPGTTDHTASAAAQVASFFAQYSNMVLNYARLCASAGGVDAFIIGSELIGLTRIRDQNGAFPAVAALQQLAANVRAILGPNTILTYGADWTEYGAYVPADGSGVFFPLDPLWADPNINVVGVDFYAPLTDWRDIGPNIDAQSFASIYDPQYIGSRIESGEAYDFYYASSADRNGQIRTPITDGAYGEPWIYRQKDLRSWWSNAHYERPNGVRNNAPTAWVAQSKPIWLTEFGFPAIDKATNQPSIFYDPKSSESGFPYFSTGGSDPAIQRLAVETFLSYWRDHSPVSPAGVKMIDIDNAFAWCWDARPYPDFPAQGQTWRDGAAYERGHWLTGRADWVPLAWIIAELCASVGVNQGDVSQLTGPQSLVLGAVADGVTSPREILSALQDVYNFDIFEIAGQLTFAWRGNARIFPLSLDDLVLDEASSASGAQESGYMLTRSQASETPANVKLSYINPYADYSQAAEGASLPTIASQDTATYSTPTVLTPAGARAAAKSLLAQLWTARDSAHFKLAPSKTFLTLGDCVAIDFGGGPLTLRIEQQNIATAREIFAKGFNPSHASPAASSAGSDMRSKPSPTTYGPALVEFMDIPLLSGDSPCPIAPRVAAWAEPWSGVSLYRNNGSSLTFAKTVPAASLMGETVTSFYPGPSNRWDLGSALVVQFYNSNAQLLAATPDDVLNGANVLAIKNGTNWELIQFCNVTLLASGKYQLSKLLRAQQSSQDGFGAPIAAGARVVLIDGAISYLPVSDSEFSQTLAIHAGPSALDPSDPSYFDHNVLIGARALKPWSPAQLRAKRASNGDVVLSWLRRTRFGGDAWDSLEVPLNEDFERYDLEILDALGAVKRTISALSAPNFLYAQAMQIQDFGAPIASISFNVYQISALAGRGIAAKGTVVL